MEFGDARKLSRSAQGAIRRMTVQAVVNGGMTQTKAAKVFGASRTSVCLWVESCRKEGEEALQSKPKGRPKGGKLTSRQMESIRKSVIGKHPYAQRQLLLGTDDNYSCAPTSASAKRSSGMSSAPRPWSFMSWSRLFGQVGGEVKL